MIKQVCEKFNVEYTSHVAHMSIKDFFDYMVASGYDLFAVVFTYYKALGFSDRLAVIKANTLVAGEALENELKK